MRPSVGPDLAQEWAAHQQRVRDFLSAWMPPASRVPTDLHSAMRYAALGKGKHLRPLICYATGEVLDIGPEDLDAMAAAVELIHAFSLVHDDLPAMDDDELRRGRPTTHVVYGEALAILAGDALQIAAFQLLASDPQLSRAPQVQLRAIRLLAEAAGSTGMTGGQAMDIAAEGRRPEMAELEDLYFGKTGQLIRASVAMPCAWRERSDPFATEQLNGFAEHIGLAFQIRDDLLEFVSTEAATGKSTNSDRDNGKATYPGLFGVAAARRRAGELYEEAMAHLEFLGRDALPLQRLANFIIQRKS